MRRGKINLLSFEDEEENDGGNEMIVKMKPQPSKLDKSKTNSEKSSLDLSQIRDRVTQMDLDEEIVLEGEVAEALFKADDAEDNDHDHNQEDYQEELPDFIPVTTKGDYWLMRDTRESEETFNTTKSRLVREDLFNEIEVDDATGSFTSFMGKSVEGRQGLMMTSKMLERDIKTEMYDLELELENDSVIDEEDAVWERLQVLKGIEKGWVEDDFYSRQAKLTTFIPPKSIAKHVETDLELVQTEKMQENIIKIAQDSKLLEDRIEALKLEIESVSSCLNGLTETERLFMRFSRFLSEKLPELRSIEEAKDKSGWEHFFDNVDVEDSDLLDLPDLLAKTMNPVYRKDVAELFIRYHFLLLDLDPNSDIESIWTSSGLSDALSKYSADIEEIFEKIYVNELEKLERVKEVLFK